MRVIAGSAKGMRLGPVPPGVRPVSDRAREGLFSSLALEVPDARVLDLYAGTGAMGIEALSRGAEHAVFVDRAYEASAAIHDNLDRTRLADRATVVTQGRERVRCPGSRDGRPVRPGPARPALRHRHLRAGAASSPRLGPDGSPTRDGRWS